MVYLEYVLLLITINMYYRYFGAKDYYWRTIYNRGNYNKL